MVSDLKMLRSKILVIEDEESLRISFQEFLRDAGYEAQVAEDADVAMGMLLAENFDVLVSDIILPRITGMDLLKSIKTASPYTEVILMTGEPTVETASVAVREGAFDYLIKPVTKDCLLKTVANAAKLKASVDESRLLKEENHLYRENLERLVSKRTQDLQESEERWHFALEGNRDGVWDWNLQTDEVFYSKHWKEMLGFTEDEISNHLNEWDKRVHPNDKNALYAKLNRYLNDEISYYETEHRVLCKDGDYKWVLCRGKVVAWTQDHKPQRMIGTQTDITQQRQAKILEADKSRILELISRGKASRTEIFEAITQIAEKHSTNIKASILLLEGRLIAHGVAPSLPIAYTKLIDGLEIGPAVGSCGTAMHRKTRVLVEDVRTDPLWADFSHLGEEYGFRACWSQPVFNPEGEVLGCFALYHEQVEKPSETEIQLIESMSHLVGITMGRKKAEEQIQMLSQAIEQSPVSVVMTDLDAKIEYVNSAFQKLTGYSASEIIGQNPRILQSGLTPQKYYEGLWQEITHGKPWQGEFQNKKKNGEIFWEHASIAPVVDEAGITRHYLAVKEDITLRRKQEKQLLRQAHYDDLTQLPNRFLSLDRLTQLLKDANRSKTFVAVLFLDLDDFKKVNDTLGHEVGDKLLIESAKRLSMIVRSGDTVGRLGGDEFIVLLPGLHDEGDARSVLTNLLEQFRAPFEIEGRELILTTSVGVAVFPGDGENTSELLRSADSAMYHAKKLGRNTSAYFTKAMNLEVSRRLALEEQMYGALERGEFCVYYQPIMNLENAQKVGAEALLRWHNPTLGNVSPEEFIPIAEQTGLIVPIGRFVLTAALEVTARFQQNCLPRCRIAVNMSPRQFRDPELVAFVEKALHDSGVSARHLELEITEGVLMSGHAYVNKALTALSEMGVSISMDDFGTGYSSLSYLRTYPFNVLKIDQSFVHDITQDPEDRALIDASIAMAHGLNLKVIAEGVETEEQLDYLKKRGCDYAQGYLFAKPMPEDALPEWISKQNKRT